MLRRWIDDDVSRRHSYARFDSPGALQERISAKLDDTAAFDLFTWYKFGDAVLRADDVRLRGPDASGFGSTSRGAFTARGTVADARIRVYLATARQQRRTERLVVEGQVFEAELTELTETVTRGRSGYEATFQLSAVRANSSGVLDATFATSGRTWSASDIARIALERVLGSSRSVPPPHLGMPDPLDWHAIVERAAGLPDLVQVLADLLVTERAITHAIFTRVHLVEARLVGPPRAVAIRVEGSRGGGRGVPESVIRVDEELRLR